MQKILMFLFCLVISAAGYAEPLLDFQVGQKAKYKVQYETKTLQMHQKGGTEFNVEIMAIDHKKGIIDAKVQLTRLHLVSTGNDPLYGSYKLFYDSAKKSKMSAKDKDASQELDKALRNVLGESLCFRIKKDLEIEELTGKLKFFEEEPSSSIPLQETAVAQTLCEFLGQIFHLADKQAGLKKYPLAIYPLAKSYDSDINIHSKHYKIAEKALFAISKNGDTSLEGKWTGESSINEKDTKSHIVIKVNGKMTFAKKNPLLQTRDIHMDLTIKQPGNQSSHCRIHQIWTSRSN